MTAITSTLLPVLPQALSADLLWAVQRLANQGWTPATSSNFSVCDPQQPDLFWISASGKDKTCLQPEDFIAVKHNGQVLEQVLEPEAENRKPSAETLLHAVVYQHNPAIGCVLHTHSVNSTVLSRYYQPATKLHFTGFEMLKGLTGIQSHTAEITLPIFANSQDMPALSQQVSRYLQQAENKPVYGFLLAGHGLYAWGSTPAEALRHVEVFEFLFTCQLEELRCRIRV